MKKLLVYSLAFFGLLSMAAAQSTSVTATITDSDSFTWNNGTYSINLIPNPNGPSALSQYSWSGGTLAYNFSGVLNSSGVLSVSLPSNSTISPGGTTWGFTICPNAVNGCFTVPVNVTGSSMNLTTTLSAAAKGPRFIDSGIAYGYGTIEVTQTTSIGVSFCVTTSIPCTLNYWNGSAWVAFSTGTGFTAGGDLSGTSTSQTVVGLKSVPFCTGFTPANGQNLQYTTASSPNPCYTAASSANTGAWTNITSSLTITGCGTNIGGVCTVSGSSTTTLTASSIPAHNRMQIVFYGGADTGTSQSNGPYLDIWFNGDNASSHYSINEVLQAGTSNPINNSGNPTNLCTVGQLNTGNVAGVSITDIPFYADTNFSKATWSVNEFGAPSAQSTSKTVGCTFSPTSAITSFSMGPFVSTTPHNFTAGSKLMVLVQD